jgi:hypothetical protein
MVEQAKLGVMRRDYVSHEWSERAKPWGWDAPGVEPPVNDLLAVGIDAAKDPRE